MKAAQIIALNAQLFPGVSLLSSSKFRKQTRLLLSPAAAAAATPATPVARGGSGRDKGAVPQEPHAQPECGEEDKEEREGDSSEQPRGGGGRGGGVEFTETESLDESLSSPASFSRQKKTGNFRKGCAAGGRAGYLSVLALLVQKCKY